MKLITKLSMTTVGAALFTLASVNAASAVQLQASGNLSGFVVGPIDEGAADISSSLGVNIGDSIGGSYSLSFDDSVFSTNEDSVEVSLTTFNLSVGTQTLVPTNPSPIINPNPLAIFRKDGDFFVFDTIVADLSYSTSSLSNIYTQLTGGKTLFGSSGEGLLFATAPLTTGWTSGTQSGGSTVEGGVTQTCQGTACRFRVNSSTSVPETTPVFGLLALGFLGMGWLNKRCKHSPRFVQQELF